AISSQRLPDEFPASLLMIAGRLQDGRIVLHDAGSFTQPSPGSDRVELEVAVVDDSNRIVPLGTVRDFVTREVATRYRGRRGQSTAFQRFAPRASIVGGNSIAAISTGESGIIELRDPTGNATQALTLPLKRRAVSDEIRAAQIATEL